MGVERRAVQRRGLRNVLDADLVELFLFQQPLERIQQQLPSPADTGIELFALTNRNFSFVHNLRIIQNAIAVD